MSVLIVLIIISITVAITFLSLFIWAVRSGQYDDTDSPAIRLLYEDKKELKNGKSESSQEFHHGKKTKSDL